MIKNKTLFWTLALAFLVVVGAGLLVRSFVLLRSVDPGFATEGTLGVQFNVPSSRYPERDGVLAFYDEFLRRLEGRPGIERAGTVGLLPLDGTSWSSQMKAEGWPQDRVGFEILHRRADRGIRARRATTDRGGRPAGTPHRRAGAGVAREIRPAERRPRRRALERPARAPSPARWCPSHPRPESACGQPRRRRGGIGVRRLHLRQLLDESPR